MGLGAPCPLLQRRQWCREVSLDFLDLMSMITFVLVNNNASGFQPPEGSGHKLLQLPLKLLKIHEASLPQKFDASGTLHMHFKSAASLFLSVKLQKSLTMLAEDAIILAWYDEQSRGPFCCSSQGRKLKLHAQKATPEELFLQAGQ